MTDLSDNQIAQFYRRSYTAVDGLWFMKTEEKYGFDVALEIDNEVWKIVPKIQARLLKSMKDADSGIEALFQCLTTKLTIDGFTYKTEVSTGGKGFRVIISSCPWHNSMLKSGRESLSGKVGALICNTEYSVWASEFNDNIKFELEHQLCKGAESCTLRFSR